MKRSFPSSEPSDDPEETVPVVLEESQSPRAAEVTRTLEPFRVRFLSGLEVPVNERQEGSALEKRTKRQTDRVMDGRMDGQING